MFPQPKKYGRYVALAVFLLFAYKNPQAAADLTQQAGDFVMKVVDQAGRYITALQS